MGSEFLKKLRHTPGQSDISSHTSGTSKGEETIQRLGKEPGREQVKNGRTARDSTSVNPKGAAPIDPKMPFFPPA